MQSLLRALQNKLLPANYAGELVEKPKYLSYAALERLSVFLCVLSIHPGKYHLEGALHKAAAGLLPHLCAIVTDNTDSEPSQTLTEEALATTLRNVLDFQVDTSMPIPRVGDKDFFLLIHLFSIYYQLFSLLHIRLET